MDRRVKREAVLLLVAVVAGGVVAVVVVHSGDGSSNREGPLAEPPDAGTMGFGVPADIGETVSVSGPFVVENTSDRTLVLDRAELVGEQRGVILRGAYVVPYPQHLTGPRPPSASIGVVYGYRLSDGDRVLEGATVAPHAQIAIVFGVSATQPGRHSWTAVEVSYHDGGQEYLRRYGFLGRICAPKAKYARRNGCPTPFDTEGAPSGASSS